MSDEFQPCDGGCTCGHVRYRVTSRPLIVHGCHCRWCQRQSGGAFAVNALVETDRVKLLSGDVEEMMLPSPSGKGQRMARCPKCRVTVWSNYYFGGLRDYIRFVRVGSLDNPDLMPPDVHIFTSTKQPWVILPPDHMAVETYYDTKTTWRPESLKRLNDIMVLASDGKE
ncbi:GFA family protein [Aliiroseovarius sp. KMU-50]|uniref:GFA family protein n=2 Tax=Aliiroseovarius salicola TaxID=3009082 RepID=A0ABT4VWA3_9RHOB|nr:GFA family protein [Aliiroseovarius sp. KMU-50]MDA5092525.1 GFA family protein [Aliiroseovarius sp. KMU-50]